MWTVISVLAGALFTLFAWFQLNDPDPAMWVLVYGTTAALSVAAGFRRLHPAVFVTWALLCIVGGLFLWLGWDGASNPMGDASQGLFAEEVVREVGGLAICVGWMGVAAVQSGLSRRRNTVDGMASEDTS
ncbi:MAG: transmembrane 220 family protein [Myxococcota bacterium]